MVEEIDPVAITDQILQSNQVGNPLTKSLTNILLLAAGTEGIRMAPQKDLFQCRYSSASLLALGINPATLVSREFAPANPHGITTSVRPGVMADDRGFLNQKRLNIPLQLAGMFAVNGEIDDAKAQLEFRRLIIEDIKLRASTAPKGSSPDRSFEEYYEKRRKLPVAFSSLRSYNFAPTQLTWIPTFDPKKFGLPRVKFRTNLDSPCLYTWFEPESFVEGIRKRHIKPSILQALNRCFPETELWKKQADHSLTLLSTQKTGNIEALCRVIGLCNRKVLNRYLRYFTNTTLLTCLSRSDLTSEQYVKAVNKLANISLVTRSIILSHMHRAPALEELPQLRGAKMPHLISSLPWKLVEQHLQHSAYEKALGVLAFRCCSTIDPDQVREMITPHSKRLKHWEECLLIEDDTIEERTAFDWDLVFGSMYSYYTSAKRLRSELFALTKSYALSFLFLCAYTSGMHLPLPTNKHWSATIMAHPNYKRACELIACSEVVVG